MIYIILIVYLLIALLVCAGRYLDFQQNRRLFLILAYIPLVLIMGLRGDGVGVDFAGVPGAEVGVVVG